MSWYHKRLALTRPSGQAAQSAKELQIDRRQDVLAAFSDMMVGTLTWERGGIGIRSGLKIRRRKACGFESHRSYHADTATARIGEPIRAVLACWRRSDAQRRGTAR